jgi:hypothetical protein
VVITPAVDRPVVVRHDRLPGDRPRSRCSALAPAPVPLPNRSSTPHPALPKLSFPSLGVAAKLGAPPHPRAPGLGAEPTPRPRAANSAASRSSLPTNSTTPTSASPPARRSAALAATYDVGQSRISGLGIDDVDKKQVS